MLTNDWLLLMVPVGPVLLALVFVVVHRIVRRTSVIVDEQITNDEGDRDSPNNKVLWFRSYAR